MIKAQELRIGNYVNVPRADQSPFRIDAFEYLCKDFGKVAQNNGTYMVMDIEVPYHPLTWELKDLSGIPLSDDILEKCGFKFGVNDNGTYYTDLNGIDQQLEIILSVDGFYPQLVQAPEMSNEDCQIVSLNQIEYLHQLQNLFYMLTGNELTMQTA